MLVAPGDARVRGPVGGGGEVADEPVETTQVAPTILGLLGIGPHQLQAVQTEHTRPLPLG